MADVTIDTYDSIFIDSILNFVYLDPYAYMYTVPIIQNTEPHINWYGCPYNLHYFYYPQ